MTSVRTLSQLDPLPSPSGPSFSSEEDLATSPVWDDESTSTLVSSSRKGKGKRKQEDNDDDTDEGAGVQQNPEAGRYPPMAEDDLETRKVEQTLKRWEELERQRRRVARHSRKIEAGSSNGREAPSSFLEDVAHQAAQLWHKSQQRDGPASRPRGGGARGHIVLEDIDEPPATPKPSPQPHAPPPPPALGTTSDPFASPEDGEAAGAGAAQPRAGPSTPTPTSAFTSATAARASESLQSTPRGSSSNDDRPILDAQPSQHPPALPLGLPDPEEEARRRRRLQLEEDTAQEKRWWTEWLCGCREDGDTQAGRTNPME